MGSQFWNLDFTQEASHDSGLGIFLTHDFQNMDGEPGDFTVSEGHGHPLVKLKVGERKGRKLLIASHLDQSVMMDQSENTELQSDPYLLHSFFSAGAQFCCALYNQSHHGNVWNYAEPKPFS